ncbi:hypothetical protein BWR59_09280 [Pseudomonas sp. Bc-h]|jgi:hypothetical protein|nr:hypothetical protein BWR59_09280 [Pseudomonas sp. Bc-h]
MAGFLFLLDLSRSANTALLIVPTLRVVTPPETLSVSLRRTRSVLGCIPTRSVGTIREPAGDGGFFAGLLWGWRIFSDQAQLPQG